MSKCDSSHAWPALGMFFQVFGRANKAADFMGAAIFQTALLTNYFLLDYMICIGQNIHITNIS